MWELISSKVLEEKGALNFYETNGFVQLLAEAQFLGDETWQNIKLMVYDLKKNVRHTDAESSINLRNAMFKLFPEDRDLAHTLELRTINVLYNFGLYKKQLLRKGGQEEMNQRQ